MALQNDFSKAQVTDLLFFPAINFLTSMAAPPKVLVRSILQVHRFSKSTSFAMVFQRPLPFKIPVINMRYALAYPTILEWGCGEYGSTVDSWIDGIDSSFP